MWEVVDIIGHYYRDHVQLLVMTRSRVQLWDGWLNRHKITRGKEVMKLRSQVLDEQSACILNSSRNIV